MAYQEKRIKEKNKRKYAKNAFKKKCKKYYINKDKRLCKNIEIRNYFNNKKYIVNSIIILKEEKNTILESLHNGLGHIGIIRLLFEIEKRGFYWNNIYNDVKKFISTCVICTTHKSNKFKKPMQNQIISYSPLERVEMDITYLNKLYPKNTSEYKYILCFVDHFSKKNFFNEI